MPAMPNAGIEQRWEVVEVVCFRMPVDASYVTAETVRVDGAPSPRATGPYAPRWFRQICGPDRSPRAA